MRALCLAAVCWALWPQLALARVERYALVIGNNRGHGDDTPLRYAESDAARIYDVLHDLGGFEAINMVLLRDEPADTVRRTLIALNERIRRTVSEPDTQAVLFVYYSGHADADALRLHETKIAVTELAQLVAGSAADFRLLVLDACRSGVLTRIKGGRILAPFALPEERLPGDGLAYLTASSANEDAQESDELRGSFFTHALVSGLLGAADRDGDGTVVLDEAYRYAYESTLRATSRTFAGTQHPTFRYDLRGHGDLVLTTPEAHADGRAQVHFPGGLSFLLMRDGADGAVVAEIAGNATSRILSLRPGRYFVRARGRDVLYEGAFSAAAGASAQIDLHGMERIDYARLVRKGARPSQLAHGPELGGQIRSTLPNASTPCIGAFAGYSVDFEEFGVGARASACTSGFESRLLRGTTNAYDLEARVFRTWDVSSFSFGVAVGGGVSLFEQRFESLGSAPDHRSVLPFLVLGTGAGWAIAAGYHALIEVGAETHFLQLEGATGEGIRETVGFALRASLGFGKRF